MPRFFNTAGPNQPARHYTLPVLARLPDVRRFIDEYKKECQNVRADFITVDNAMTFDKALIEFLAQRQTRF